MFLLESAPPRPFSNSKPSQRIIAVLALFASAPRNGTTRQCCAICPWRNLSIRSINRSSLRSRSWLSVPRRCEYDKLICAVLLRRGQIGSLIPMRHGPERAVGRSPGKTNAFTYASRPKGEKHMSKKASEHHKKASKHLTHAAHHHGEAAKHHEAGSHEKAAHHAHVARGHVIHGRVHAEEAVKAHLEEHGKK